MRVVAAGRAAPARRLIMADGKPDKRAPSADKLRAEIDAGRTGDKVAFPDPAAAPLGTDEEAAGTPPTPEHLDIAFAQEPRRPTRHRYRNGGRIAIVLIAIAFIATIALLLAVSGA
jgi:hypothetical protein